MPGGGYVEVELEIGGAGANERPDRMLHGRIIMERRADPRRRYGHQAPVVAEMTGDDRDELMEELFRLARDNSALARSLLRLRSARQHAD
jgi:glycine cleavage system regulatory protein